MTDSPLQSGSLSNTFQECAGEQEAAEAVVRGQYVTAPPTEDSTDNVNTDSDLAPSERRVTLRAGLPTSDKGGARFCSEHAECLAWMVTSIALIVLLLRWPRQY